MTGHQGLSSLVLEDRFRVWVWRARSVVEGPTEHGGLPHSTPSGPDELRNGGPYCAGPIVRPTAHHHQYHMINSKLFGETLSPQTPDT